MRTTPSEAFDPIDIASLCLWRQEESGDNRERIRRLLSNLPLAVQQELTPRQREILRLRFTGGMSVTAIAEKLGLNKSTVSRSLARSMERLYKSLRYSL
ncbi:sigma-70 family RNA polymerase sigma factor [Vescimonas sp.]|jgi:RNA polymerase sigma factor (sigma-70 family)|uniref:sigma-70 family RNA polymerase sigma factor n=1 Tax=Vescimonas sp. TaxID=2892404 RepID=UPI001ECA00F7|nr:sigma-70 family RNA polymerase sigma factor [Clostridiales bacterium]MBS6458170.1 sigma-70 family RNA polymerase sigma factor [Bacillota bacterium]